MLPATCSLTTATLLSAEDTNATTVEHCETRADTLDRGQWWRS